MDSKTVPLKKTQFILGHSKATTTDRYLSELKGESQSVMDVISEKLHIDTTHEDGKKEKGAGMISQPLLKKIYTYKALRPCWHLASPRGFEPLSPA
jgi:hypothetical protein